MRRPPIALLALTILLFTDCASSSAAKRPKQQKNLLGRPMSVEALDGPVTLSSVDERWSGARAQTRVNLPIKKGQNGDGWSSSEWLRAESETIRMRFSVNPRDRLREVLPQKNLLAGVQLICDGWSVQNPKKGEGIQVDFRFVNYPARARAEFNTDLEHLAEVERFLRFQVMGVTRADEMLSSNAAGVAAPAAMPAPAAAPGSARPPVPDAAPAPPARKRGLRITGAEAQPEAASPGETIDLLVTYEVSSGDGTSVSVRETRVLAKGPTQIATFEATVERAPGTFSSRQTITVPTNAVPGFYSYRATVAFRELSDEYSAIFEVR
jgi:hypothetical protein